MHSCCCGFSIDSSPRVGKSDFFPNTSEDKKEGMGQKWLPKSRWRFAKLLWDHLSDQSSQIRSLKCIMLCNCVEQYNFILLNMCPPSILTSAARHPKTMWSMQTRELFSRRQQSSYEETLQCAHSAFLLCHNCNAPSHWYWSLLSSRTRSTSWCSPLIQSWTCHFGIS